MASGGNSPVDMTEELDQGTETPPMSEQDQEFIEHFQTAFRNTPTSGHSSMYLNVLKTESAEVIQATVPNDVMVEHLQVYYGKKPMNAKSKNILAIQIVSLRSLKKVAELEKEMRAVNIDNERLEDALSREKLINRQTTTVVGPKKSLAFNPTTTTVTMTIPQTPSGIPRPIAPSQLAAQMAAQITPQLIPSQATQPTQQSYESMEISQPTQQSSQPDFSFPSYQIVPPGYFDQLNQQAPQQASQQSVQYISQGNQFPS